MPRKEKRKAEQPPKEEEEEDQEEEEEAPAASKSLYELLGVERTATQAEIKKAYYSLALKLHPDKNPGDQDAHAKFQSLQKVWAVLGDPDKRKAYDETGVTEEELLGAASETLYSYFRAIFREVTEADLDDFYDKYRGSEEERADLLKLYRQHKGDMSQVFDWLMCSDAQLDSHRLLDAINEAIGKGEVKAYKPFKSWSRRVQATPRPAQDPLAKRAGRAGGAAGSVALVAIRQGAQQRKATFESMISQLEAKYGGGGGGGGSAGEEDGDEEEAGAGANGKRKVGSKQGDARPGRKAKALVAARGGGGGGGAAAGEPTEEEFEAARARLEARRQKAVAKEQDEEDEDEEEEEEPKGKRRGKSSASRGAGKPERRSQATAGDDDDGEEEEEEEAVKQKKVKESKKKEKKAKLGA